MPTTKTLVVEHLFDTRWDSTSRSLRSTVVTLDDVTDAIRAVNPRVAGNPAYQQLSDRNPANFLRDFIRHRGAANSNWPASVLSRGYTARQRSGDRACFEFVPLQPGQTEPFVSSVPEVTETTSVHQIESASLPLAARRLGRTDEPWLIQVAVRLRLIETHMTLESSVPVVQIDHLQMAVKLRHSEVDALFLATVSTDGGQHREMLVSCEAKTRSDDILPDQLLGQVRALFQVPAIPQDTIIPIAIKTIGDSRVLLVEFNSVDRDEIADVDELTVATMAVYEFVPSVPGIGR